MGIAVDATDRAGHARSGLVLGALGILGFSFSLPATKLAVADLNPWFVAFGRAVAAGLMALVVLRVARAVRPTGEQWRSLAIVSGGVVIGFPLCTGLALQTVDAAHGAVVIAILPAATALAAVLRGGERPGRAFWLAALSGLAITLIFTVAQSGGDFGAADLLLLAAVVVCAFGYAEGGVLARDLGGANTICWGLLLALPITVPVTVVAVALAGLHGGANAWLGFAYVSLISMFLGFFAWYAGLARGGIARVGQVQLMQPVLTLLWSAAILGEHVGPGTALAAVAVLASVAATQRARIGTSADGRRMPTR